MKIAEYTLLAAGILMVGGWWLSGKRIEVLGSGGLTVVWASFIIGLIAVQSWDWLMIVQGAVTLVLLLTANHYYLRGRTARIEARARAERRGIVA